MSWLGRLCETYDSVIGCACDEGNPLLPVGFVKKTVKFHVLLDSQGRFVSAEELPKNTTYAIPSTPQAEARTGSKGQPYPLVEQLQYLVGDKVNSRPKHYLEALNRYLEALNRWCSEPDAPPCLKTLASYLSEGNLLTDLTQTAHLTVKLDASGSNKQDDSKSFVCFSVVEPGQGASRLWERADVLESWERHFLKGISESRAVCYIEGKQGAILKNHPKVEGQAKLVSAKDDAFPFQYKGRFTEDWSAARVGYTAAIHAYNTLDWLMARQGMRQYGIFWLVWNTNGFKMNVPGGAGFEDEQDEQDEEDETALPLADTFEAYARAVCEAAKGYGNRMADYRQDRASFVVILGLQAATTGRMSVVYEQEFPGGNYIDNLENWYRTCCWSMYRFKDKGYRVSSPTLRQIAKAVLGREEVMMADRDKKLEKAVTKTARELYQRLLPCIWDRRKLPQDVVQRAFRRATAPLGFSGQDGSWSRKSWEECISVACALIRKAAMEDFSGAETGLYSIRLDEAWTDRSYLYGRLVAIAHQLEIDQSEDQDRRTQAVRLMQRLVERPCETWEQIHRALIPYLARLSPKSASWYQKWLGQAESRFSLSDRRSNRPLSPLFLPGFFCQRQALFATASDMPEAPVPDLSDRPARFGALLAVADQVEAFATNGERTGCTNALNLLGPFAQNPAYGWLNIHNKMLPYLENLGEQAEFYARLIGKIEQMFDAAERLDRRPLEPCYIHGYYTMRQYLWTQSDSRPPFSPAVRVPVDILPVNRDALYGAMLGLADRLERWVLAQAGQPRVTNALRLMPVFARKPAQTWTYLQVKLRPYLRQLGPQAQKFDAMLSEWEAQLRKEGWASNAPLQDGYLRAFYLTAFPTRNT